MARPIAQLVIEGMLLSLLGGAGALGVAAGGSQFVRRWLVGDGAWTGGAVDGRVLVFTSAVALLTGFLTSLVPAIQASRPDVTAALKAGSREGTIQRSRTRDMLLVAQTLLAILLLAGAGMFIRSLRNVAALDLGVEASAVTVALPFSMSWGTSIFIPGRHLPRLHQQTVHYAATDEYFKVLGVHTLMGRQFASTDREGTAPVAIVNETVARIYFPGQSPIGACIQVGSDTLPCTTIVGVLTNTRRQDLVEGLVPQVYRPLDQFSPAVTNSIVSFFGYTLIARTRGDASAMVEPLRQTIQSVGASVPYANVQTMKDLLGRHTRTWELGARVFSAFGALALVLAGVGLFSVVAFTMAQRTHEFGVRTALGAQRADLLRLTMARGVAPAAGGIIAGTALTIALGKLVESLLFQESPRDPVVLGVAAAALFTCAVLASLVPGWRAATVDPTIAMRAD